MEQWLNAYGGGQREPPISVLAMLCAEGDCNVKPGTDIIGICPINLKSVQKKKHIYFLELKLQLSVFQYFKYINCTILKAIAV